MSPRCPICSQLHPLAQCVTYARANAGLRAFIRRVWVELPAIPPEGETWERVFELYAAVPGVELADGPEWTVWFPGRALDGLMGAREIVCLSAKPHNVSTVWDVLIPKLRTLPGIKRAKWRQILDNRDGVETIVIYLQNRQARDRLIDVMDRLLKRRRVGADVVPGELREEFFQLGVAKGTAPVGGLKGVSIASFADPKPSRGIQLAQLIGDAHDRMPAGTENPDAFLGAVLSGMVEEEFDIAKPFQRLRLPRLSLDRGGASKK